MIKTSCDACSRASSVSLPSPSALCPARNAFCASSVRLPPGPAMQIFYSIGRIAPSSLCKLLVSLKPRKLGRFVMAKKKKKRAEKEGDGGAFADDPWNPAPSPESIYNDAASPQRLPLQVPQLMEARRHSSYQGSPPRSSINYIMGRNSDVLPGFPRFSTSSSSLYERLSVERGLDLPPIVKLGAFADESAILNRQDSAMSLAQHRRSSCSSSATSSFVSFTSSRLKHVYTRQKDLLRNDLARTQPHIGELFAGNQFLTRVTAAPAVPPSARENALLQPSSGLLDASLSCREAELKDRIILFL